jgi:hypothetical protein
MTALSKEITRRCEVIEEAYELMLAYAGQGLPRDQGNAPGAEIREHLRRIDGALEGLADLFSSDAQEESLPGARELDSYLAVLSRDAESSRAAIRIVLAQPSIGSQLIDNLNASMHLRALLTDLFLIDEIFKAHAASSAAMRNGSAR